MRKLRQSAIAGRFYPKEVERLRHEIDSYLAAVPADAISTVPPKAIVVPHAGTMYSGPIAAYGWAQARLLLGQLDRVVMIGPAHYQPVVGLGLSSADAFVTPLGEVPLDAAGRDLLLADSLVNIDDRAHGPEHCLEVQLPFLLRTLGPVPVLPILAGFADENWVAACLDRVWTDRTLLVVSTDLSHYLSYTEASRKDRATADAICRLRPGDIGAEDACGRLPTKALLRLAMQKGLTVQLLDLRNSGDTAGDRARVVGYGAFAVHR